MKIIDLLIGIVCIGILNSVTYAQDEASSMQTTSELSDSLLDSYSIEELLQFKNYYLEQRTKLESEKKNLLENGIKESEAFVLQHTRFFE